MLVLNVVLERVPNGRIVGTPGPPSLPRPIFYISPCGVCCEDARTEEGSMRFHPNGNNLDLVDRWLLFSSGPASVGISAERFQICEYFPL